MSDGGGRDWRRLGIAFALCLMAVLGGVVLYFAVPYDAEPEAAAAVSENDAVVIEERGGVHVLSPAGDEATTGLVFYPGARVDPEAYVPTLAPLAEAGVLVVIPEMPLNLAFFDSGAAADPIAEFETVDRWYVGGHSLGGAMACRYAAANPDEVEGVVLYASYCDRDVSDTELAVLSVLGTEDGVLSADTERENRDLLPAEAEIVEIGGANHAGFGAYGEQFRDGEATIGDEEARDRIAAVTVDWFERRSDR
ncbi:alpha/beta fold hydrolase [Natronorarus salvus]|uniref:alpha/beta fold hydrolase n=1 Tax=Natronorarus salvus TaxID=3117733 RepID=UPI002F26ACB8